MNDWKRSLRKRLHPQQTQIDAPVIEDRQGEEVRRIALAQSHRKAVEESRLCGDALTNQIAAILGIEPGPPPNRETPEESVARSRLRYRQTRGEAFIQSISSVLADSDNQYGREIHERLQDQLGVCPTNQPEESGEE